MSKYLPTVFILFTFSTQAKQEDWYTLWGAGIASNSYSDIREKEVNRLEQTDLKMSESKMNAFGFYWPLSEQEILGVIGNGITTSFSSSGNKCYGFKEVAYTDNTLSLSYLKFYGREIGLGWYYRGDLGLNSSKSRYSENKCSDPSEFTRERDDDNGVAVLLSGGYGFRYSEETRILVGLEFTQTFIENNEVNSVALTINGLW